MAYGLGKAADGGFAVDTVDEIREQAIELMTLDGMVAPMDDPVRSILVQRLTDKIYQLGLVGLDVWNMLNISNATGANLDYLVANVGLRRKAGVPQVLTVQLTSVNVGAGYTIPAGTRFTTTDGLYSYDLIANTTITSTDPITVSVQSTTQGEHPVVVGDKLVADLYIPQLSDIEITEITTAGTANETDEELRLRFFGHYLSFVGSIEFMLDRLREIDLLRKVGENHNNTSSTDSDGLPAYSTEFLILPYQNTDETAVKQAVAQKILTFMLPGLPTYGSTSVTIPDYIGRDRTVNFTMASQIRTEIFFRIAQKEDKTFSDTIVPTVKTQMAEYINNLDIGADISMTKLWGIISPVATFDIVDYGIRRVGASTWQKDNLTIGIREAAIIDTDSIAISTTAGL